MAMRCYLPVAVLGSVKDREGTARGLSTLCVDLAASDLRCNPLLELIHRPYEGKFEIHSVHI